MTRYNSKLRARDLKKANAALRSELQYEVQYSAELYGQLRHVQKLWCKETVERGLENNKLRRQLRNHRILSGVLLVLAVAGWLV